MATKVLLSGYTRHTGLGIYQATLDGDKLSLPELFIKTGNPTYLTVDAADQRLFTITTQDDQGGVAAYDISGAPHRISAVLAPGSSPAYVSYDAARHLLYDANYHKGTANAYHVAANGALTLSDTVTHQGQGPEPEQESAHIHYTDQTPDHRVAVCDLGTDQVVTYDVDQGQFHQASLYQANPGFGPRHLIFHPNGLYAYLVGELSSKISVLRYEADSGAFTEVQTISLIPADFTAHNGSAAVRISSDGRFVYASNRGHNSITVLALSQRGDHVETIQRISTYGDFPRDFNLDPTENFVLAANQNSNNLTLYARDHQTGLLTVAQKDIPCPECVCVYFLK